MMRNTSLMNERFDTTTHRKFAFCVCTCLLHTLMHTEIVENYIYVYCKQYGTM